MHQFDNPVDPAESIDPVESAIKYAHIVIPIVGAVLILLMAFIAMLFGAPNGAWS